MHTIGAFLAASRRPPSGFFFLLKNPINGFIKKNKKKKFDTKLPVLNMTALCKCGNLRGLDYRVSVRTSNYTYLSSRRYNNVFFSVF